MSKILILIGGHLCNAPRPYKEAQALADAGHNVIIGGVWFQSEYVERDRLLMVNKNWQFVPIIDFQPRNKLINWLIRGKSRIAKEIFKKFGIFSPALLGYGATDMLKYAYRIKSRFNYCSLRGRALGRQSIARLSFQSRRIYIYLS